MKIYWNTLLIYTSLLLGSTVGFAQEADSTSTFVELEGRISELFISSGLPGLSLVVVDKDSIIYQKSLGYADLQEEKPYTHSTVQNIGSISKTFLGVAIMKAQEMGKLSLDDPINKYLPFDVVHPKYPMSAITLRHLASHSSGIKDGHIYYKSYLLESSDIKDKYDNSRINKYVRVMQKNDRLSVDAFLENILSEKGKWYSRKHYSKSHPGESFKYSNIGATLASLVVEQATGMAYETFVEEFIFEPLKMYGSGWSKNASNDTVFATRYFPGPEAFPDYSCITRADGAIVTSTKDISNYLIEVLNGVNGNGYLLMPESYREMTERKVFGKQSSGVFWGISKSGVLNHSGSDPGILAITAIYPDANRGAFMMTNISADIDGKMMKALQAIWMSLKYHKWN